MRIGLRLLVPGAAIAIFSLGLTRSAPAPQAEAASANALSFRITFGERQEIPRDYSGSISLSSGEVARLSPWRFFDDDEIDGRSGWTLKTKRARFESQPDQARFMSTSVQIENVVPAGIVATVDAPASATAKISTSRGDFDVRLSELIYDRVLSFLEGDVVVQRTPAANQISEPSTVSDGEHSDYPSVTTANDGAVWVAWQSYQDKGDHVFARHSTATGWSNTFRLTDEKTDVYRTAIAADIQGRVWVVWSERSGQKWDLHARRLQGGAWTSRQTLTSANHPNIFHRMVADSAGNLHLVGGGQQQTTRVPILAARGLLIPAEYSVVFGRSECLAGAGAARCAQINLELVRVYLSEAKKNRFTWVEGGGRAGWSLTSGGRQRAIELQNALAPPKTLAGAQGRAGAGRGIADSRRAIESRRIRSTRAWEMWSRGTGEIVARDAAAVFRIDVYSTGRTRNMKINRLQSLFLEIAEIREFLTEMSRLLE